VRCNDPGRSLSFLKNIRDQCRHDFAGNGSMRLNTKGCGGVVLR
jgi:hypothetical protein